MFVFDNKISHFSDCNAQLTSSSGNFTFCSGESITLTCSLTSSSHIWRLPTSSTDIAVFSGHPDNSASDGRILFTVTSKDSNDHITSSTMTFNASVDLISNGSLVFCGGAINDTSRVTFNETVDTVGE